jgi:hypothetical protein
MNDLHTSLRPHRKQFQEAIGGGVQLPSAAPQIENIRERARTCRARQNYLADSLVGNFYNELSQIER